MTTPLSPNEPKPSQLLAEVMDKLKLIEELVASLKPSLDAAILGVMQLEADDADRTETAGSASAASEDETAAAPNHPLYVRWDRQRNARLFATKDPAKREMQLVKDSTVNMLLSHALDLASLDPLPCGLLQAGAADPAAPVPKWPSHFLWLYAIAENYYYPTPPKNPTQFMRGWVHQLNEYTAGFGSPLLKGIWGTQKYEATGAFGPQPGEADKLKEGSPWLPIRDVLAMARQLSEVLRRYAGTKVPGEAVLVDAKQRLDELFHFDPANLAGLIWACHGWDGVPLWTRVEPDLRFAAQRQANLWCALLLDMAQTGQAIEDARHRGVKRPALKETSLRAKMLANALAMPGEPAVPWLQRLQAQATTCQMKPTIANWDTLPDGVRYVAEAKARGPKTSRCRDAATIVAGAAATLLASGKAGGLANAEVAVIRLIRARAGMASGVMSSLPGVGKGGDAGADVPSDDE